MQKSLIVSLTMVYWLVGLFTVALAQPQLSRSLPTDLATRRFGHDWPVFLGPTGDGKSKETGIIRNWSNRGLRVLWDAPLLQSYGTCTVSRGRLFQFDSKPLGGEKQEGQVLCLNAETGERLWEYSYTYDYKDTYGYNNGPRASPIVDGDRIYAYGVDGRLVCLNVANGKEIWSVDANARFGVLQNFFGVGSNPVVSGDLVIVMVGGSPPGTQRIDRAKGNGTGIVAFDKFRGNVAYRLSDELASYASLKVTNGGRPRCFAFMRGGLLGFDPQNGKQDFFFPWRARILESVNASVPVVFGNYVFVSETYGPGSALLDYTSIRDQMPKVVWQDEKRGPKSLQTHWNTAIHHDGYIYGSSGRHSYNAELRCIEALSGKVMWSVPGLSRCSLMFADEHFVCLGETGKLSLIKAAPDGYQEVTTVVLKDDRGQQLLKPPAWAAPILSRGLLYLRGADRLVCAELILSGV